MSTLKERLIEVMGTKGWTHADVVRVSGESSSVVSQWLGKGSKEIKSIGKLEAALRLESESGFSALWIAKGTGAKLAAKVQAAAEDRPGTNRIPGKWHPVIAWETPDDLPDNQFALVERRAVKLSAGSGKMVFEEEVLPPLPFRADWLRARRVTRHSNLVIVYAEGDSMEPDIKDGDAVLLDMGQTEIVDGLVYAIDYGGHLRIKRLQKRFDSGLIIISDNSSKHPAQSLSPDEARHITVLGRAIWRGGAM